MSENYFLASSYIMPWIACYQFNSCDNIVLYTTFRTHDSRTQLRRWPNITQIYHEIFDPADALLDYKRKVEQGFRKIITSYAEITVPIQRGERFARLGLAPSSRLEQIRIMTHRTNEAGGFHISWETGLETVTHFGGNLAGEFDSLVPYKYIGR